MPDGNEAPDEGRSAAGRDQYCEAAGAGRKKLVAKFGSQHGVGRKDGHGRDATSQRDPNDGDQELPLHGDLTCILARKVARTGWDLRDSHHVSGVLNHWIASSRLPTKRAASDALRRAEATLWSVQFCFNG